MAKSHSSSSPSEAVGVSDVSHIFCRYFTFLLALTGIFALTGRSHILFSMSEGRSCTIQLLTLDEYMHNGKDSDHYSYIPFVTLHSWQ